MTFPLLSYAALIRITNRRTPYVQIAEAHLHALIRDVLRDVAFDEAWYRQTYSDVDEAIIAGEFPDGKTHYVQVGYFENRLPREILVDESFYLNSYADVREAIASGAVANVQDHFMMAGFVEGRSPSEGWRL